MTFLQFLGQKMRPEKHADNQGQPPFTKARPRPKAFLHSIAVCITMYKNMLHVFITTKASTLRVKLDTQINYACVYGLI